jgi:hypothetical protein
VGACASKDGIAPRTTATPEINAFDIRITRVSFNFVAIFALRLSRA